MTIVTKERTVLLMFHFSGKKVLATALASVLCMASVSASACTAVYVGSDLTADGTTMFARSEDISNSYNKMYFAIPAGVHKAGEVYNGCYGFNYTFTKDSYSYTAFQDDNGDGVDGVCPDCGGTHTHTPYQSGGTNEMGVTVSATETIGCSDVMYDADPYKDEGIEEAEITTVVLSEAASAKEGVELLLSIYDTAGCAGGSGVFIADDKETWYIENATGTQYVAVKLSSSLAFAQPNMSVIGLIDLDDTENVIASADLIAVAEKAGTYVGDKDANTIDYVASYNADQTAGSRMVNALAYFGEANAKEEPAAADYTISNVNEAGEIVAFYSNITLDHAWTVEDVVGYYHIDGIGSTRNLETHIFQISAEDSITDTVEWIAVDDAAINVFVPYYPMLTTDTYAAYQLSTAKAEFVTEEPTEGLYYATTTYQRNEAGERVAVEGYKVLPSNWADSYYWTFDALSNLYEYGNLTDEQKTAIDTKLAELQSDCYAVYEQMKTDVAAAATTEDAAAAATKLSMDAAQKVHEAAVELVNEVK
jgi:dipeptidase